MDEFAGMNMAGWRRAGAMLVAIAVARALSATLNYICNRKLVFKSKVPKRTSFAKYWLLVLFIMASGYASTAFLSRIFDVRGIAITVLKILVETVLFFVSYNIQKRWIFPGEQGDGGVK